MIPETRADATRPGNARWTDVRTVMRAFVRDALSIVAFLRVDRFDDDGRLRTYRPNDVTPFDNMMDVDS